VPGFFFDASQVVLAGDDAVTTTCAPGLAGNATRRCIWNGPNSASGVWADPINNCVRTFLAVTAVRYLREISHN